ncbi:hypothetical protein ACS0TY_019053 [Phlomoides rotata]
MEIENLKHLEYLYLCGNKSLMELPREIGNLICLRGLDLSYNKSLEELPREIGNLIRLKYLDLRWNRSLKEVPESICNLQIRLGNDDFEKAVEDAREAGLRNKIHIEEILMRFKDEMDDNGSQVRMALIEALEPHPKLQRLSIQFYEGFKLPFWMVSPLNQLKKVSLYYCYRLTSLPSLGKLPFLEEIFMYRMEVLQFVGREFLGITRGDIFNNVFPKLKKLIFVECVKWEEWEDITVEEEEESATFSVMPCLTVLRIRGCDSLKALPRRLLRKASSLETLNISNSHVLQQCYKEKDDSYSRFIFQNNPRLQLSFDNQ